MSSEMSWRINVRNVETQLRIGIHAHEHEPQRILVNATIEGVYPASPKGIEDCFNYDPVYHLVTQEWNKRPHVDLLETYVRELLEFIFRQDERVRFVRASVCKTDIFKHAESVGVEAEWTRDDFKKYMP